MKKRLKKKAILASEALVFLVIFFVGRWVGVLMITWLKTYDILTLSPTPSVFSKLATIFALAAFILLKILHKRTL